MAIPGLVEPSELDSELRRRLTRVKLVDCSFAMPGSGFSPRESFLQKRIGDAVFFDVDEICDRESALPHMVPSPALFAQAVGALGISNDDDLVVYGQSGIIMGPCRAWWMFRLFGHEKVRVLNGGLPLWESYGFPVETGRFESPAPRKFHPGFVPELLKRIDEVRAASREGSSCIVDARAPERFAGRVAEPRPGLRSGHIPGSRNLPVGALVDPSSGRLKSPDDIGTLLEAYGVDRDRPVIATCGSGVTACVIALALFATGRNDASVYDGSWSEWGRDCRDTDIETSL